MPSKCDALTCLWQGEEQGEEGGSAGFQAYSTDPSAFGDLGIASRGTGDSTALDGGMGSMTGWRAIAAQVQLIQRTAQTSDTPGWLEQM